MKSHDCSSAVAAHSKDIFLDSFKKYFVDIIRSGIIRPLGQEIESYLRRKSHALTQHTTSIPLPLQSQAQTQSGVLKGPTLRFAQCLLFIELPGLRILDCVLNIKNEISRYLDRDFYNLVTVSISDSRYYRVMKALACHRLGLGLLETYLPMGSLGQGMDLLEVMHNIDAFVTQYSYNMNMQQFIEFRPSTTASTKHLNVLTIASIAASVQLHGLGVVSTTVNYTYQHLAEQFNAFSRFLSDDYMQGYLSRENRWFEKHKNEAAVNNTYPHQRAMKFVSDMKRLGELPCSIQTRRPTLLFILLPSHSINLL